MDERAQMGRRELNKLQTREALLNAAKDLFNEVGTFTTVDEIADRAEVSRATFFNYFPSKDDLLGGLYTELVGALDHLVDDLMARDLGTGARIEEVFGDFARTAESDAVYLLSFTAELERVATTEQVADRTEHLAGLFARILGAGVERGDVRVDHPVDFLAQMVTGIYLTTMRTGRRAADPVAFRPEFERAGAFAAEAVGVRG